LEVVDVPVRNRQGFGVDFLSLGVGLVFGLGLLALDFCFFGFAAFLLHALLVVLVVFLSGMGPLLFYLFLAVLFHHLIFALFTVLALFHFFFPVFSCILLSFFVALTFFF